jgi:hypothetical protein
MTKLDFSYLIAPTPTADFLDQYWQKSVLFLKRDEGDRYRGLIDAADADAIVSLANQLPSEAVDVVGKTLPSETAKSGNALAELFGKGATIRVRAIERFHEQLGELCRNLEEELGFPVRANLYCTPPNSRGFDLHFDTHEVFVLQLLGKKQWQIFDPTTPQPLEFVPARSAGKTIQDVDEAEVGSLALEALLKPGDCLYLPRGFVHQAGSRDEPSVHLTIGIHVLQEIADVAASHAGRSSGDDHVAALVNSETKLQGNGLLRFYLAADGTMAGLASEEREFWLPVSFAPALRFVTEQRLFSPNEIPGSITANGKLAFVRRLLKDGFLRLAQ